MSGEGHVWRAVGPNAEELWNQCVNCVATESSPEGRLPCPHQPAASTQPSASQDDGLAEVLRRHRMMGTSDVDCVCAADGCWWTSTNGVDWYDHLAEAVRAHLAQTAPEPDAADLLAVTLAVDALRSEQRDAVAVLDEALAKVAEAEARLERALSDRDELEVRAMQVSASADEWWGLYDQELRAHERTRAALAQLTDPEAGGVSES